jgi:hypothetical protein
MKARWASMAILTAAVAGLACGAPAEMDPGETGSEEIGGGTETSGEDGADTGVPLEPASFFVFDEVIFYDGYAATLDEPVPEGVVRHRNDLYATKLSEDELALIQNTLVMDVFIGALCDNYDRIGSVFVSLVPKGETEYDPAEVTRFEIARFITPFMNMNRPPTIVPYQFDLASVVPMLTNDDVLAEYDVWFELSVFGVPYAANTEIYGCEGRNDTSRGAVELHTDSTADRLPFDNATALAVAESFNNHQDGASDAVGTTRKTVPFTLDNDTEETRLVLITSNHGARNTSDGTTSCTSMAPRFTCTSPGERAASLSASTTPRATASTVPCPRATRSGRRSATGVRGT